LPLGSAKVVAVGGIALPEARSPGGCSLAAGAWARGALSDGLGRAARHLDVSTEPIDDIAAWAVAMGCKTIVTPYAPVGWSADRLANAERDLGACGIKLHRIRRSWDTDRWPDAKAAFYAFCASVNR
jgi:deoxyribodipyrimidine photo-lyase